MPQIADRAEELRSQLVRIYQQLSAAGEALPSENSLQSKAEEMRERASFVDDLIAGAPTSLELRDEDHYWSSLNREFTSQRKVLTSRATTLENEVQFLESQRLVWQTTWDQIHLTPGIRQVIDRVQQELENIKSTRLQVQDQLNRVLTIQNQISQEERRITDVLTKLTNARARLNGHLFERDGHPLWRSRAGPELGRPSALSLQHAVDRELKDSETFGPSAFRTFGLIVCYCLALLTVFRLKAYVSEHSLPERAHEVLLVLSRPYSIALLLTLVLTVGRSQSATSGIAFLFALLWMVAALRILPGLLGSELRPLVYAFAPILLLEGTRVLVPFSSVIKREIFILNMLVSIGVLGWSIRRSRRRRLEEKGLRGRFLVLTIHSTIGMLSIAVAANVFGFLSLSQLIAMIALLGGFGGACLYCAARVLTLLSYLVFRTHSVRNALQARAGAAERWVSRMLVYGAVLVWLNGILSVLAIRDYVIGGVSDALRYRFGYGPVRFTLGGLFSILIIIVAGFLFTKLVTAVLQKIVLPRLPLQRGTSYAVSTVTYYVLLLLVVVAGLAGAGVELNKFTVLTGALGVGLGFGLQNVVNNFVSGVILLFERPINLGDTVEVGGLVGTVRRIGARSSTVVTFQGAEVIVPNSNLLSNQVINWTLSSQWRRVDIPVAIAHGTDPEQVLKLLVDVANSQPGVLGERPPMAFFLGFGQSALNFELRFWAAHQDTWFQLQSDVAVAVAKALRTAGIQVPFPQHDLHIRSVDPSVRRLMSSTEFADPSFLYCAAPQQPALTQSSQPVRDTKEKQ